MCSVLLSGLCVVHFLFIYLLLISFIYTVVDCTEDITLN